MMKKSMSAAEAMTMVREVRLIFPNNGFLKQIARLDNELKGLECANGYKESNDNKFYQENPYVKPLEKLLEYQDSSTQKRICVIS